MSVRTVLVVTVGGSYQPILRSIEENRPDFVYFLCSADVERAKGSYVQVVGEGKVLKSDFKLPQPDLPNLVTLAALRPDQFEIRRITHFDTLNDCYLTAAKLIQDIHQRHPEATILADYTGGTKSMTAGLAAAALDDGRCELQIVTGLRADLERVADRTEFVRPVRVWEVQVRRRLETVRQFLTRFDYASAVRLLEETARRFSSDETHQLLIRWVSVSRGFDAWDRFDHLAARDLLRRVGGAVDRYKAFLNILVEGKGHGFELVEDLLRNAERRAAQERYDDAVGRLYRALELTGQQWLLKRHGLDTSNIVLDAVPESQRSELERSRGNDDRIRIGQLAAWDLLATLPDDPLGAHFLPRREQLLTFLSVRNQSLFAHGQQPIRAAAYQSLAVTVIPFVEQAIEYGLQSLGSRRVAQLPQFPTDYE